MGVYQLNRPHRRLLCLWAYTPFINPTELLCPACCLRIYKAPRPHTPPIDNRGSMRWYNYWSISGVDLSCRAILPLLLDQWEHCLWCHLDLVAQKQGAAFFLERICKKDFLRINILVILNMHILLVTKHLKMTSLLTKGNLLILFPFRILESCLYWRASQVWNKR